MAETVLAKMAVEISANAANFTKSLNAVDGRLKSFSTGLKDIAGTVGIAFGVSQVASFAFEVAKLAGEAEGVRAAFERLPESEALMSRLKDATAGTVSELELMKRTVQATNFGISLESLPQLLEFAAVRAQQTGQSVDYLVDSIVTGIGRKSPLILDNLGISAVKLKEQMGGVALATADIGEVSAAVGRIAAEELEKMGGFSENTATKIARLSAAWENFKVVLGNVVTAGGILEGVLTNLTGILSAISDGDNANFIQFQKNLAESIKNDSEPAIKTMTRELNLLRNELKTPISESFAKTLISDFKLNQEQSDRFLKIIKEINGEVKKTTPVKVADPIQVTTLESLQEKVKQLNEQFSTTDVNDQKRLANIGAEIIGINAQIKVLEDLKKAREAANINVTNQGTVDAYQEALQELNKELEKTNVNDTARIRVLSAQIAGYEQAIAKVNDLKRSFQGLGEVVITPPDLSSLLDPLKIIQESAGALTFETQATAFEQVVGRFEAGLDKLAVKSVTATEQIKGVFIDMAPLVTDAVSGVADALGKAAVGAGNFGQDILKIVAGFAGQLGKILIATGVGMLAAKKLITNPYTAIIAGALLVGLAAAANASIGSAHSKSFGGTASGGAAGATSNVSSFQRTGTRPEDRIQFNVDFKAQGTELVAVVNNTVNRSKRTG